MIANAKSAMNWYGLASVACIVIWFVGFAKNSSLGPAGLVAGWSLLLLGGAFGVISALRQRGGWVYLLLPVTVCILFLVALLNRF